MVPKSAMPAASYLHPQVVVIPAAGMGTRMRGADPDLPRELPKELLPVAGLPAIFHALLLALDAGVKHAAVVLRESKECVRELLENPATARAAYPDCGNTAARIASSLTLHFCYQQAPRGECDALAAAWPVIRKHTGNAPVTVVYPDNLVEKHALPLPMLQTLAVASACTGRETVALMDPGPATRHDISDSGRVRLAAWPDSNELHGNHTALPLTIHAVSHFLRKGSGAFTPRFPGELRTCGIYAATERWFAAIDEAIADGLPDEGDELTDGVVRRRMVDQGEQFAGVAVGGGVWDIGNPIGYRKAIDRMGRGRCRADVLQSLCCRRNRD